MYTEFYKLKGPPFQLTPDHRFFFSSTVHKKAMAHLNYGLHQGEGFIIITGDVGAGKTTLAGHLISALDSSRYLATTVVTTHLAADDMLRMVASGFGVDYENTDKATLLRRIEAYLATNFEEGRRCLLLIDEAQNLSVKALEELRMLSNFHIDGQAPLQSFLLGQPQFRVTLGSVDLDQLRQRVIASYHLGPVDENETREYVRHRLRAVGWDNDPEITSDAYHEIYVHTGGVPRRINVLCSRLLLFGFLEDQHRLDGDMVKQVAEDLSRETELVVDRQAAQATQAEQEKVPLVATGGGGNEVVSQQLPSDAAAPLAGGGAGNSGLDHRMTAVEGQLQRDERMLGRAQHLISRHERMLHRVQQIIVHHMSGGNPPKKDEP